MKPYRKHHSFVGLRQRRTSPDQRPRLKTLLERPQLDPIVRQACSEALGAGPFQLTPNVVDELSRLEDKHLERYLRYRYRYDIFPAQKKLDLYPPLVQIEPTSACNFRCVFCYQTEKDFTRKSNGHMGTMSLDLFQRVVDELEGKVEAVTLASRGEPLLCADLEKMLDYARGKFLALKLNTNASLLDEKRCHAILQSDAQTLVFSADAAAEPQYSRLRVGGKLDVVLGNVRKFAELRAKQYSKSRLITRVSGVKVAGSGELEDMEKVWGDYVDQVAFVAYNPWENVYAAPPAGVDAPCSDLWRRIFIWWDGCANPCDVDFKSSLAVGNVKERTVSALWRSEGYEGLREKHLAKKRDKLSPCGSCALV